MERVTVYTLSSLWAEIIAELQQKNKDLSNPLHLKALTPAEAKYCVKKEKQHWLGHLLDLLFLELSQHLPQLGMTADESLSHILLQYRYTLNCELAKI